MATGAKPRRGKQPAPVRRKTVSKLDISRTRNILEQIEIAHNVLSSSAVSPLVKARLSTTIEQLSEHLPDSGSALAPRVASPTAAAPGKEPSGPAWAARFPGSADPNACVEPFRTNLKAFLGALAAAAASTHISATFRPPERAYLMHWCWKIANSDVLPQDAPPMVGVNIEWVHTDGTGQPDVTKSRSAAKQMVTAYGLVAQPALQSRHTEGRAVDMDISWSADLDIKTKAGTTTRISTVPRNGMNPDLQTVGAGYGVVKAVFAGDPPHWSDDGH